MLHKNENLQQLMSTLVPISRLAPQYLRELLKQAELVEVSKGKFLFKQGDKDSYTFYLIEGELDMYHDGHVSKHLTAGTEAARYALAQLQPRQLSAKAKTPVSVLRFERSVLDRLLTLEEQTGAEGPVEVSEIETEDSADWMTRMLQSELFA
nr:cyclic nucleotide-binding domain-containing protein [Gammaproteobacteria bacterium]